MSEVRSPLAPQPRWDVPLVKPKVPAWPYLSIPPGESRSVYLMNEHVQVTQVHPFERFTLGCTGDDGLCWCNHREHKTLVQGCILGKTKPGAERCLVLLTANALWECPQLVRRDIDLRGWILTLYKAKGDQNSKMTARLEPAPGNIGGTLKAPSVREMMYRIWAGGAKRLRLRGVGNELLASAEEWWDKHGNQAPMN